MMSRQGQETTSGAGMLAEDRARAASVGIDQYFVKPCDPQVLWKAVTDCLRTPRRQPRIAAIRYQAQAGERAVAED